VALHRTPYIALREPAVEPLPDTRPGWWIARELGLRLGLADYFQWSSIEEYLNTRLMSVGLSLDRLREAGGVFTWPGKPYLEDYGEGETPFPTPSGKIEIYSEALARAGFDPLPVYEPVEEPPPGYFRLLYGRHPLHTFGKTQNNPWLAEVYPENEVWVNDEAAAALGLKNGDLVLLENQDGVRSGPGAGAGDPAYPQGCRLSGSRLRPSGFPVEPGGGTGGRATTCSSPGIVWIRSRAGRGCG